MRDYRDAKATAKRLREALAERGVRLAHSDCLELVARSFGFKDWHVLSATIETDGPAPEPAAPPPSWSGPALLLRDVVMFPKMTAPIFVGREMSIRAQQRAYEGEQEVLLVTQRRQTDDNPGADAVYEIGVIADVLERTVLPDQTVKLLVRGRQRARVLGLADAAGYRQAQAEPAPSPAVPADADALVRDAAAAFAAYAEGNERIDDATRARISGITHAGVLADLIAAYAKGSITAKQALLETLDPRQRLEKALQLLGPPPAKAA
jgi:ATP-dependent Lon protease